MKGFLSMRSKKKLITNKVRLENKLKKRIIIALILLILLILLLYIFTVIVYNRGNFSITLDKNLYYTKGLIIYDNPNNKSYKPELIAPEPDNFTNISYRWLPLDLDSATSGSHNGDDYLAYTFYVENVGKEIADYWSETVIYDVVKDVDKAVRVRIYRNGDYVTYAKLSSSGNAEPNTVPFEEENLIVRNHVKNFKPGSLDKYTIVIWIEGSDPDCTDELVGGEFKFYMNFNSEYVED